MPWPTCRAPTTTSNGCSARTAVTSGGRPPARPTARRPCCAARCGCSPVWPPGCAAGTPAIWPVPIGRAGARCAPASSAVGTPAYCGRSSAAIPQPTSAGSNSSFASQLCRPSFFVRRLLLRARRLGVPRPGPLGAVAEFLEVVPAALRPDLAAEPGRHPRRHLRPRPQPAAGGRLGQRGPQRRLVLGPQQRPGARVPAPPVAQAVRPTLVVAARDLADPAPPVAGDLRHLPLAPAPAQEPDDLEVGPSHRRPGRPLTLAQLRGAQVSRQTRG